MRNPLDCLFRTKTGIMCECEISVELVCAVWRGIPLWINPCTRLRVITHTYSSQTTHTPHPSSQTHFIPISCLLVGLNGNNGLLVNQEKTDEIQDPWFQERDVKTKTLYCRQMPWDRLYRKDLAYLTFFLGGGGVVSTVMASSLWGCSLLMWRLLSTKLVTIMWKT